MMRWLLSALLCALLTCASVAQVGQIPRYSPVVTGGGCSQSTTLQARMDGAQNTSAVQALICGAVTDGWLSKLDVFYVFAINSTANAKLNWVSTSFSAALNGTITFTANQGYTGDGTTGFITTGFTPSTAGGNYTQNSASMGACNFNATAAAAGNNSYLGAIDATTTTFLAVNGSTFYDLNDNGAFPSFAQSSVQGLWSANRTSSTATALYLAGSSVATATVTSLSNVSQSIFVMATNNTGSAAFFSNLQLGAAFIGGALTGTDESNIASRLHTYFTAIGAPSGC